MQLGRPWDWSRAFHFVGDEHTRCPTLLLQELARQDKRTMETVVCSGMPNSEKENEPFSNRILFGFRELHEGSVDVIDG